MRASDIGSPHVVFNKISPEIDSFWDTLVCGYIKGGDARRALNIYQKMQQDISHLSAYTYVALLKACTKLKAIETGSQLHGKINDSGLLERNPYLSTTLVDMYAKCGLLTEAQELFNQLLVHDVVSWNALISAYLHHECSEEAFACFEMMHLKGVVANAVTITSTLKACGGLQAISKGKQLHSQIIHSGLMEKNQFVGNALVDMYAKCGILARATEVFNCLPARNVVTWNTLISGFVQEQCNEEALEAFDQMQSEGIAPDGRTFSCVLKACGSLKALEMGTELHDDIEKRRLLNSDQIVGNALVDMYAKCGVLAKAQEVFDCLQNHDVVSWSTLIAGYVQLECFREALHSYELMQIQGVLPNEVTYAFVLKACGSTNSRDKGQEVHAELCKKEIYKTSQLVGNALIDMYSKFGLLNKAQEVFDTLPAHNLVSWNTLISGYVQHEYGKEALNLFERMQRLCISPNEVTYACIFKACGLTGAVDKGQELHAEVDAKRLLGSNIIVGNALVDMYCKCGELTIALDVFDQLSHRDTVSWNTLIAGYLQEERPEESLNFFERMQSQGIFIDAVTLACCLNACGSTGATEKGKILHCRAQQEGLLRTNLLVGNALVDMYVKCGMLSKAQKAFDLLPTRDIVSWTTLITGFAQLGKDAAVVGSFERMRGEGIIPNPVTFLSVLSACSHSGLVEKGQMYFKCMSEECNITPTLEHHICMVDLFSRAGQLDRAVAYIKESSPHPNIMMWLTVLGACRKWRNVELGRQAFQQVLLMDEHEASAYLCMYNIYTDAGMHASAKDVETMRKRNTTFI